MTANGRARHVPHRVDGHDIRGRLRAIRLVVMDVDGVLTDGRMILSQRGDELKAFHTHDGVAVELARRAGLKTAMVTGESTSIARRRGEKLGVDAVILGARRKADVVATLLAEYELDAGAVAYVGDDLIDVPALRRVGLAVAVSDAAAEVKEVCHLVTKAGGGQGAVREVIELILRAKGVWDAVLQGFMRDHGDDGAEPRASERRRPSRQAL